jgi:hypothetical protein
MQTYRARNPRQSPLWQCAHRHYDQFEQRYPEHYQPLYGLKTSPNTSCATPSPSKR